MDIVLAAVDELVAIRWEQPLNYLAFALLALYVAIAAALLKWGKLEQLGRLDLKAGKHHNYGVEGIRGPLAFFVVIAHYLSVQNISLAGSFGRSSADHERLASTAGLAVCYFFAITGYLFWNKFLRNPDTDVKVMFYGRIARIFPAFFALCLISLALIALEAPSAYLERPQVLLSEILSMLTLGHYDVSFSPWLVLT